MRRGPADNLRLNVQDSDLESIVCQILDQLIVEILDWHILRFTGDAVEHIEVG